jgi:hypothetical protein
LSKPSAITSTALEKTLAKGETLKIMWSGGSFKIQDCKVRGAESGFTNIWTNTKKTVLQT